MVQLLEKSSPHPHVISFLFFSLWSNHSWPMNVLHLPLILFTSTEKTKITLNLQLILIQTILYFFKFFSLFAAPDSISEQGLSLKKLIDKKSEFSKLLRITAVYNFAYVNTLTHRHCPLIRLPQNLQRRFECNENPQVAMSYWANQERLIIVTRRKTL